MTPFRPKKKILPAAQQRLWPKLRNAPKLGMVLYGGTAVALRLGHRPSVDFDFFTEKPLDKSALHKAFPFLGQSTALQDAPNTFTVLAPFGDLESERVKVSFFGGVDFGRVNEPTCTEDGVLLVASLDDLMATKLKVLLQRVEAKDYLDIAAMVSAGVNLAKGLASARLLYGLNFQPSESLKALTYFEGGDLDSLSAEVKTSLVKAASQVRDLPAVNLMSKSLALTPQQLRSMNMDLGL